MSGVYELFVGHQATVEADLSAKEHGADNGFEEKNQETCRARFIAATADLSALGELDDIPINELRQGSIVKKSP